MHASSGPSGLVWSQTTDARMVGLPEGNDGPLSEEALPGHAFIVELIKVDDRRSVRSSHQGKTLPIEGLERRSRGVRAAMGCETEDVAGKEDSV